MLNKLIFSFSRFSFLLIFLAMSSCDKEDFLMKKSWEGLLTGYWELKEIEENGKVISAESLGYHQYLHKNYIGWMLDGFPERTEVDSMTIFHEDQRYLKSRIVNKLNVDYKNKTYTGLLSEGSYFTLKLVIDELTGRDELILSEFSNSLDALQKAKKYRYIRTKENQSPF